MTMVQAIAKDSAGIPRLWTTAATEFEAETVLRRDIEAYCRTRRDKRPAEFTIEYQAWRGEV